ncbi:MAG: hypothetical protein H6R01_590 [Burkholderiaceae bacterium]|nr:hypothetical protein [Burkholderiaceae bacterium]
MKALKLLLSLLFALFVAIPGAALPQPSGKTRNTSPEEIKKLNIFLSNFSEVFMQPFTSRSLNDAQLIQFAVAHNYQNREKLFEKFPDGEKARLKEKHVAESARKYFGRNITKHQSAGDYTYRNGYYYLTPSSGEMQQFSQASNVRHLGDDRYAVDVNVFAASSGWVGSITGTPATWKQGNDDVPELAYKMKATVAKKIDANGKATYTLLEYVRNQSSDKDRK